ncbi:phosphoribosylanthranilate isomerase [Heyndrickxia sp. MSNUG]|uniref:phosphoribosylanthranilate isomerase n=1 Tax=Heyndrickxia sp. MSNUG TaxID=3136677 RepID=UPI003C2D1C48
MKVKICGIKSQEAAKFAVEHGADAIGFVFAKSKRQIPVMDAKEIINELPASVWKVGVFVNEDAETIVQTAKTAGLTHIQLHGEEQMEAYENIDLPIIRSVSVSPGEELTRVKKLKANFVLLDSPPEKFHGGNGMSFNWNLAEGIGAFQQNVILAGGLNGDNVQAAISKIQPFMVDVSSGVETDGQKDLSKIKDFINKAKGIEEE